MKELNRAVQVAVEEWVIPTYPIPPAEEMPMASTRGILEAAVLKESTMPSN